MQSKKSFNIQLLYTTALVEALSLMWQFFMPPAWVSPNILIIPLFFMSITFLIHSFIQKGMEGRFQNFINRYLIVTTVKLLGLLGILGLYIYLFTEDALPFVFAFFINYLIFSIFEAKALLVKNKDIK